MATLHGLVSGLGHANVVTYLQSGNVLLATPRTDAGAIASEIEAAITATAGLRVRVLLRSADQLRSLIAANPLPAAAADPARYLVTFLDRPPDPARVSAIDPRQFEPDVFRFGDQAVYVWYRAGLNDSRLARLTWDRLLGVTATARNWNTVMRLADLSRRPPFVATE